MDEEEQMSALQSQLSDMKTMWTIELENRRSQEELLQAKLLVIKSFITSKQRSEKKELEVIRQRLKTAGALVTCLKAKADVMEKTHLYCSSSGIEVQEGVSSINKYSIPLTAWSKSIELSDFELSDQEKGSRLDDVGSFDESDGACSGNIVKPRLLVSDVIEGLLKRVMVAERETAAEREKVNVCQTEITEKKLHIEKMSRRLEEMERVTLGINENLKEMRQRVDDMTQENFRQRQRAVQNEQELLRVRQGVETLTFGITSLASLRQTLLSLDKQCESMGMLFERLVASTARSEKLNADRDAQIQELQLENDRLVAMLDHKEAQFVAVNELCKVLTLKLQ